MTHYKKGDILADRYRIKSFLDAGGMQEVYIAQDETFTRPVVVKAPKNESAAKRFKRSAVLSAQVNHPSVAKTLDFFVHSEMEHLVEEFIAGENLRQRMDRYSTFDPFLAAHVFHHLATGLAASHHVGVCHRDLKPSNILLSNEAWPTIVKISDFGIAKMAEEEIAAAIELGVEKSITTSATLVGALPYMAPEAINTPKETGLPADVWSVGAILYEMLSGEKPFGQGLPAVSKIVSGIAPSMPKNLGNNSQFGLIFGELCEIISKCLLSVPSKRPTADNLVEALSGLCYSVEDRERGTVKSFGHGKKAIGFIIDTKGNDVFFHQDCCYGAVPTTGQKVEFSRHPGGGADRAFPVIAVKP